MQWGCYVNNLNWDLKFGAPTWLCHVLARQSKLQNKGQDVSRPLIQQSRSSIGQFR